MNCFASHHQDCSPQVSLRWLLLSQRKGHLIVVVRNLKDELVSLHYFRGVPEDGWYGNEQGPKDSTADLRRALQEKPRSHSDLVFLPSRRLAMFWHSTRHKNMTDEYTQLLETYESHA